MANIKLFGNKIQPACKYCAKAMKVTDKGHRVLCGRYGIVMPDYRCRHYMYDPLKRIPKRRPPLRQFDPGDFEL